MNIAIIGAGRVGQTLGHQWASTGHRVTFGVRNPADPKYQSLMESAAGDIRLNGIAEAVSDAEVVLLAVPWTAVPDVLGTVGDLAGQVVIDCTNPVQPDLKALTIGHTTSAAEQIARWAPSAKVVKCFNTTGSANMTDPVIDGIPITMPLCGDDDAAKRVVATLAEEIGFEVIDVGPLETARLLEPMAMLWIYLAVHRGQGTDFAWKLLRR